MFSNESSQILLRTWSYFTMKSKERNKKLKNVLNFNENKRKKIVKVLNISLIFFMQNIVFYVLSVDFGVFY